MTRAERYWHLVQLRSLRCLTYMTEINKRKRELQQLRSEKLELELTLRKHQSRLDDVKLKHQQAKSKISIHCSTEYHALQSDVSSCRGKINQLDNQISVTNRAPAFIKSPLPSSRRDALVVLFFLHMPTDIDLWCKMLIASKSMLLQRGTKPRFDDYPQFLASIKNPTVPLSWALYFKSLRASNRSEHDLLSAKSFSG
jgi:hypothetical protein